MSSRQDQSRKSLPEPFGLIGVIVGFVLSYVYYHVIFNKIPSQYWPTHLIALMPIIALILTPPALFERIYWRWRS